MSDQGAACHADPIPEEGCPILVVTALTGFSYKKATLSHFWCQITKMLTWELVPTLSLG